MMKITKIAKQYNILNVLFHTCMKIFRIPVSVCLFLNSMTLKVFECFNDDWPQINQSINPLFSNVGY